MKVKSESEVAQSCPTLSDPMHCSPPGSSVHGIFQARVLEWGAIAFSTNKASGGDRIPVELFQILKDGCESAALNMPANLESSAVTTGLERSVFIPIPKKGNAKECSNYHTIALISHASKVMLKILQARFQ